MSANNDHEFDIYSKLIFPNNIRLFRLRAGYKKLSAFSKECKNITYIRLSKIEGGEAAARAEELMYIANVLQVDALDLLIDISNEQFSIERWASEAISPEFLAYEDEKYSVLLASALKLKRIKQLRMSLLQFQNEFGINSIAVSRLENGFKPISKWQPSIQKIIFGIFEVRTEAELRQLLDELYREGVLSSFMQNIRQASERISKTKKINAELRENIKSMRVKNPRPANFLHSKILNENSSGGHDGQQILAADNSIDSNEADINSGVIKCIDFSTNHVKGHFQAVAETNQKVEYTDLGPRAWAARLHPRHFGLSGDGRVTLVVDPDRPALSGEFAVLESPSGFRIVNIKSTSEGKKFGSCLNSSEIIETEGIEDKFSSVVHIRM